MKKLIRKWIAKFIFNILEENQSNYLITNLYDNLNTKIIKLNSENSQLKHDLNKLKDIEHILNVAVDVHTNSESWAVISIKGKTDYVKFVNLGQAEIREIHKFISKFEGNNISVDSPFPINYKRRF